MLIVMAVWAFLKLPETKFVRVTREKGVSGVTHMVDTIKAGVSQIRGNTVLVSIAMVTLFGGSPAKALIVYTAHISLWTTSCRKVRPFIGSVHFMPSHFC